MHLRYLIGGTGNQILQIISASRGSTFSNILNSKIATSILGWTYFPNELKVPTKILHLILLPIVFSDFFCAKLFKFSVFTTFDTVQIKIRGRFEFFSVGYFQNYAINDAVVSIKPIVEKLIGKTRSKYSKFPVVAHFRGGDSLTASNKEIFGSLTRNYYEECLRQISLHHADNSIIFLTDDVSACTRMLGSKANMVKICKCSVEETAYLCVNSEYFICSNSTFGLAFAAARGFQKTYIPKPFQANGLDFNIDSAVRINAYD